MTKEKQNTSAGCTALSGGIYPLCKYLDKMMRSAYGIYSLIDNTSTSGLDVCH